MKREVIITWTSSKVVTIDIPDYSFSYDEIRSMVNEEAENCIPEGTACTDEWNYEFQGTAPKEKGEENMPPDDCWVTIGALTVATNVYGVTVKGSPVEMVNSGRWRNLEGNDTALNHLEKILSVDTSSLPPHTGWFSKSFKNYQDYRVVGISPKPGESVISPGYAGYVIDESGMLIAVIMPSYSDAYKTDYSKYFQFNSQPFQFNETMPAHNEEI